MIVLSWNILAEEWGEYKLGVKREKRILNIINILKDFSPDIIMLQEVMKTEYSILKKIFSGDYVISRLEKSYWEGLTGESGLVTMKKRTLIKNIKVVNVHLDDVSENKRIKQLKDILSDNIKYKKIIIGGDFNENIINEKFYDILYKNNFLSSFKKEDYENENMTFVYKEKLLIDNIFYKGFENANSLIIDKKCRNNYKCQLRKIGSDHYPVITEIF